VDLEVLRSLIRDVPDFPEPGIVFKDITPVLADPAALRGLIEATVAPFADAGITKVAGIEARGFILASPAATRLEAGFVPLRKPGKLPWTVVREEYSLEYGTDALEVHKDAVTADDRVLVVDDVIATGGTARAAVRLLEKLGADVVGVSVFVELAFLAGKDQLDGVPLHALVVYD
jgi:adenine phosphoribosyltransferase